jgi:hypothetical protein
VIVLGKTKRVIQAEKRLREVEQNLKDPIDLDVVTKALRDVVDIFLAILKDA